MIRVGGLAPLSTTDYPGRLAAVVFVQGCPWRCAYCHNPHLQPRAARRDAPPWEWVLQFLERRAGLLEAVVFSGGEPTADAGLPAAMEAVRGLGYRVGLHTAGAYPRRLARVLPLADWVGLDVKGPPSAYARITGHASSARAAQASLGLVIASGVDHEVRTTWHPDLLPQAELLDLVSALRARGAARFALQEARGAGFATAAADAALRRAMQARWPGAVVRDVL